MNLNKSIIKFVSASLLLGTLSCTANYEEINQNPYQPDDLGVYAITALMLNLQDKMMPEGENFSQYVDCLMAGGLSGYVADSNLGVGWSGRFATYNPSQAWMAIPFNDFYTKLYPNYFKLQNLTKDELFLALADLFRVATMNRVTDTYGPIPYTKVGVANALQAPYDSQKDVYMQMFADLDGVIEVLTRLSANSFTSAADQIYRGNIGQWARFANTLKLRLAMRVVYADPAMAQKMAEEAVNSQAGVLNSATDMAQRTVADHNPWQRFMVAWNDARISADLTSFMNGYNDPRRAVYFDMTTFANNTPAPSYNGLRRGIAQGTFDPKSHGYSTMKVSESTPILVMTASEAAFLCAEGALRGWNMKGIDAKTYYQKGVTLSFAERGVAIENYLSDAVSVPAAYTDPLGKHSASIASSVTVAWSDAADFETNFERIITQKWIAIFPNTQEAWSEYRRTGYPKLMPVVNNLSQGGVVSDSQGARRLPFPETEYQENGANVQKAVAFLSSESILNKGDNMATRMWWDRNPRIKE